MGERTLGHAGHPGPGEDGQPPAAGPPQERRGGSAREQSFHFIVLFVIRTSAEFSVY